ncbi:DUF6053 domain-containing protein [Lysobacter sp. CA199]|uniref:DUF6053 domain-containing protein n=1 Tax=Lysobacter sp. CA199 TaxID=3455608 RepID=UPI003F8CFEC3
MATTIATIEFSRRDGDFCWRGPSAPTFFSPRGCCSGRCAAIGSKGIGAEAPPTKEFVATKKNRCARS